MNRRWICALLTAVMLFCMLPGTKVQTAATETKSSLKTSSQLVAVLKKMEGFLQYPVWDYKQWTVGYGTRCPDDMLEIYKKKGITEDAATELLYDFLEYFEREVNKFASSNGITLNQHQFDALVSFTYNNGSGWMRDVDGYLQRAIITGDTSNALVYGMLLWSVAGGDYILTSRRLCEANIYINGIYKAYNTTNSLPEDYKFVYLDGNGGQVQYAIHGYNAKDPAGIITNFSEIPTGVSSEGKAFVYEFDGWYTQPSGGNKVEVLDGSLPNGSILYAHWKTPSGKAATLSKGEKIDPLKVTASSSIKIRTGPGTFYPDKKVLAKDAQVTITEIFVDDDITWGKCEDGWLSLAYTNYKELITIPEDTEWPKAGTVKGTQVNVRSGPGTDHAVVYQKNTGDRVQISETQKANDLIWGKMEDGNWICMSYVTLDSQESADPVPTPTVTGIKLLKAPEKTEYVQMQDGLDLMGSVLQITYSDETIRACTISREMIQNYSNASLGEHTVSVAVSGFTASFKVNIIKATVEFRNEDGTVLSREQYAYGEKVKVPEVPEKPADDAGPFEFAGWDKTVTACNGDAVYTAVFRRPEETKPTEPSEPTDATDPSTPSEPSVPAEPTGIPGDFDKNETVNEDDAIYLLRHILLPEDYPVEGATDFTGDGKTNEDDAIYLLRHILLPEDYPLTK